MKSQITTTDCKMCDNQIPNWRTDEFCCEACKVADYVNRMFGKQIYYLKSKSQTVVSENMETKQ
jgi:hypothetical protein